MPRYSTGKTKLSTEDRIARAQSYRVHGLTGFIDRFPLGFGTLPEKIVYDALSRRGIPFYYLNDIELNIPEIDFREFRQADFILPTLRIIIEVQGAHWHSTPKAIEDDAFKFALYQQVGWKPLAWWDYEIQSNINMLFMQEPLLAPYQIDLQRTSTSELTPMRRTKTDSSQGIRTLNRKRAERLRYKKKAPSIKTRKSNNYGRFTSIQ